MTDEQKQSTDRAAIDRLAAERAKREEAEVLLKYADYSMGLRIGDRIKITNLPDSPDFYGTIQGTTPIEDSLGHITGYSLKLEPDLAP